MSAGFPASSTPPGRPGRPGARGPRRAQRPATGGPAAHSGGAPGHGPADEPPDEPGGGRSSDDTDLGWGEGGAVAAPDDERYLHERPPHWG